MSALNLSTRPVGPATAAARRLEAAAPAPGSDRRILIEESGEPGAFVYTVIDRRTGRIVAELPREAFAG